MEDLFKDKAPFVAGDLIIADEKAMYDQKSSVRDVIGSRVAVCSATPYAIPNIVNGNLVFDWKWPHPLDIVPVHFYRKATKEEIKNELLELDDDIASLNFKKEILLKRLEDCDDSANGNSL